MWVFYVLFLCFVCWISLRLRATLNLSWNKVICMHMYIAALYKKIAIIWDVSFFVNDLRLGIMSRFNMGIRVQSSLIEPLLSETDFFLHAKVNLQTEWTGVLFVEGIKNWSLSFNASFSVFLFIGQEPTTWPANNCLQVMIYSCAMLSNCVSLQMMFCSLSRWNHSFLLPLIILTWKWQNGRYKLRDQIIKRYYWSWLSQDILICSVAQINNICLSP